MSYKTENTKSNAAISPINFGDVNAAILISKAIAEFHLSATGKNDVFDKTIFCEYYSKRIKEAGRIKRQIGGGRGGSLSDFDILFLAGYDKYISCAKDVADDICGCIPNMKVSPCIGGITDYSIYFDGSGKVLINMKDGGVGSFRVTDLYFLIRKFVKRGGEPAAAASIVGAYSDVNPLNDTDTFFLSKYLTFPHKFFDINNRYYNNKRTYNNVRLYKKAENEMDVWSKLREAAKSLE